MLEEILTATRARAGKLELADLRARARDRGPIRSFEGALVAPGLDVIAEVKRRSPSRGTLAVDLDLVGQVSAYERGGAAALSVLTEPDFFSGSLDDLAAARAAVGVPVLRKDFIVNEAQIWESRLAGADAVLLIVAALSDDELGRFLAAVAEAGLDALVEVHSAPEAQRALAAGARIVGVNNRDLATFSVDLATAESLVSMLADAPVRVAESGISTPADARRMADAGYQAVLVGEALVRSEDPASLVAELREVDV